MIPVVREGFRLSRDRFALPLDTSSLDPKSKRAVTICNLFVNHKLALGDIVRLLDEDHGTVILTLLDQRIIQDRRDNPTGATDGQERRQSRGAPLMVPRLFQSLLIANRADSGQQREQGLQPIE
jgi:hypothetical protein